MAIIVSISLSSELILSAESSGFPFNMSHLSRLAHAASDRDYVRMGLKQGEGHDEKEPSAVSL